MPFSRELSGSHHAGRLADVLTYQWIEGWCPITGATNKKYSICFAIMADAGAYTVRSPYRARIDIPLTGATLTVNDGTTVPPQIVTQPQSITLPGSISNFYLVARALPLRPISGRYNTPFRSHLVNLYIPSVQKRSGNFNVVVPTARKRSLQ